MDAGAIVTAIVSTMTDGLIGIGQGIGEALSAMVTAIFLTGTGSEQTISVFGYMIFIFAGLSLGFALTRWCLNFLTSFGKRNR